MSFLNPRSTDTEVIAKLSETVEQLAQSVQQVTQNLTTLQQDQVRITGNMEILLQQNQEIQQQPAQLPQEPAAKSLEQYTEEELSTLSPNQIFAIQKQEMQSMISSSIQESISPLQNDFTSYKALTAQELATNKLKALMSETGVDGKPLRPDFKEWLPDMVQMKKDDSAMNGLSFEKLYILAKGSNPDKNQELESKYNPKPKQLPAYGGQLSDVAFQTAEEGNLSVKDASLEAMKEFNETEILEGIEISNLSPS